MSEFVPVTRYSRCKRYSGAILKCPNCGSITTTGHLAWTVKRCQNCESHINKFDWLIKK
mgnify:FL=1